VPRQPAGISAALCAAVAACAIVSGEPMRLGDTEECGRTHVRSTDSRSGAAIEYGLAGSGTFRALVDAIAHSDLIVYVTAKFEMAVLLDGEIHFVTNVASHRYMRVLVRGELSPWDRAAMIAHELQHAREVADAPWVADNAAMDALYHRIGFAVGIDRHETDAAREVANKVMQELAISAGAGQPR
jgi:hypothetical protein